MYFPTVTEIFPQVERALESMETAAEQLYQEEKPTYMMDDAAATRDRM